MNKHFGLILASVTIAATTVLGSALTPMYAEDESATLQSKIDAAENGETVTLDQDYTESVTVSDKNITLDLNGKTLTNESGKDTITVNSGATLTVQGNGTVDNVSNGCAAVYNNGTTTLSNVTVTRSVGSKSGNTFYVILNHGTMTIDESTVTTDGGSSAMIDDGYYNYGNNTNAREGYVKGTNGVNPTLTINSGTFTGGKYNVKVDDGGNLIINGGTFSGAQEVLIANFNTTTINGGTFTATTTDDVSEGIIASAHQDDNLDKGEVIINGGTFNAENAAVVSVFNGRENDTATYTVNGGTFNSDSFVGKKYAELIKVINGPNVERTYNATGDIVLTTMSSSTSSGSATTSEKVTAVTMYRLYNPNSGEHFYTSSEDEKAAVIKAGWNDEGIGWYAPSTSKTPVYRLYNPNAGDHHYTTSKEEADNLVAAGWNDEGIGWYSDDAKTVKLYRDYNPNAVAGTHNFTTSEDEHNNLVKLGWNDEGIGWYGVTAPKK